MDKPMPKDTTAFIVDDEGKTCELRGGVNVSVEDGRTYHLGRRRQHLQGLLRRRDRRRIHALREPCGDRGGFGKLRQSAPQSMI